jgi:hypothetical protein
MSRVSLGTWRIVIIVALVVTGVAVLANGFNDEAASGVVPTSSGSVSGTPTATNEPSEPASPSQAETPTETPPPQKKADVPIAVFNGTDVTGLAGAAWETLTGAGYASAQQPTNAPAQGAETTIVYYRGGESAAQNKSDATYIAKKYFDFDQGPAKVEELRSVFDDVLAPTAQVAIVVGQDYADSIAA